MSTEKVLENIKNTLKKHGQSHILAFWEHLDKDQRQNLLTQIEELNFSKIDDWVLNYIKNPVFATVSADFSPAKSYPPHPVEAEQKHKYAKAIKLGKELIGKGKVAALITAGGQATRLGFEGPKGNFPVSPLENKTLFQIFSETIAAVSKKYKK